MFESIINFFKKIGKTEKETGKSKDAAKERLHLVLMQDRANVSADFLDLMKQEIIEVIKKYIDVDENAIDVRLTNKANGDGTTGAPALYANIPIVSIKEGVKEIAKEDKQEVVPVEKQEEIKEISKEEIKAINKEEKKEIKDAQAVIATVKEEKREENEAKEKAQEEASKEQQNQEEKKEETVTQKK